MQTAAAPVPSPWSKGLIDALAETDFRHAYLRDQVCSNVAFQIRALREQPGRSWLQEDLAARAGKTQSVISRLENPDYGKPTLQTLLDIAIAFDVGLLVQFVEWDDWLGRMGNVSPHALRKRSFEYSRLMAGAKEPVLPIEGAPLKNTLADFTATPSKRGAMMGFEQLKNAMTMDRVPA